MVRIRKTILYILFLGLVFISFGFQIDNAIIPKDQILAGGPPKDGIPAILKPSFVQADSAGFLEDDDQVIGVNIKGTARAYPIKILNWHEVVNDTVNSEPIMVSF